MSLKNLKQIALAGGAAAALPVAGHAGVVHVTPASPISITTDTNVYLDLNGDSQNDFSFLVGVGPVGETYVAGAVPTSSFAYEVPLGPNPPYPLNLASGTVLEDGSPLAFTSSQSKLSGSFNAVQKGYFPIDGTTPGFLGVHFAAGDGGHFGWIALTTTIVPTSQLPTDILADAINSITISDWAYESTPDGQILVGDTGDTAAPEPSSLALFAAGAAGIEVFRRRRNRAN